MNDRTSSLQEWLWKTKDNKLNLRPIKIEEVRRYPVVDTNQQLIMIFTIGIIGIEEIIFRSIRNDYAISLALID